jgi:hypothetical protein
MEDSNSYLKINRAEKLIISVETGENGGEIHTEKINKILSESCEKRNMCIDVFRCNFNPEDRGTVDTIVELFEQANEEIKDALNL